MLDPLPYALLAQQAYSALPDIGLASSAARAIRRTTADGLAIAFPGTNNLACWLADLDCAVVEVPGLGGLHRGFRDAYLSIADRLWLATTGAAPIIPCGHSEGAALALIYAAELCLEGHPPSAVFAFEPPRITTDDTLGQVLAAHGVQVVLTQLGNDIVPMVPRQIHPWRHPGTLQLFGPAALPVPNTLDHEIARLVAAVRAAAPVEA